MRNWLSVWSFTSGKAASAAFSLLVLASVAPPRMFTNSKMFVGCGYTWSKVPCGMITFPNAGGPFGAT